MGLPQTADPIAAKKANLAMVDVKVIQEIPDLRAGKVANARPISFVNTHKAWGSESTANVE
jgi:hypothetical protein